MKKYKNSGKLIVSLIMIMSMFILSCEYQEFADADYPDQLIYMPAANYNNYMIDVVPEARGSSPTPGYPERFAVDMQTRKFKVLLAAYRSGLFPEGSFNINISVNTDTITALLNLPGKLPAQTSLLASDKFSIVSSVMMEDGERLAKFDLEVDLDFLLNNYPNNKYAIAIAVSSPDREVNPVLATTIIVIDTKIMKPTASFDASPSAADSKTINFVNKSVNGVNYLWDFGDGSTGNGKKISHKYSDAGTYTVKLTTQGITGEENQAEYTAQIIVQ